VEVEGPRRRYLFELEEAPRAGAVTIVPGDRPGQAVLRAGRLHGVRVGDGYTVLPTGAALDSARPIAMASVTRVDLHSAIAELRFSPSETVLPAGAQAVQVASAAATREIELVAEEPDRAAISRAIEQARRFTIAAPGSHTQALAKVSLRAGQLELTTPDGAPVVPAMPYSPANLVKLMTNLRMLTAAQSLRELASEPGQLAETAVEVSWGRVERGEPVALAAAGELLAVGSKIFIRVTNTHPQGKSLYVSIFDIGVAQRIQLLTDDSGKHLAAGQTFTLGESVDGRLEGLELGWSSELPEDAVRTESLVILVTEAAVDLSALEAPGATRGRAPGATRSVASPLAQLVAQFQYGTTRDVKQTPLVPDGYLVRYVSFELSPWSLLATGTQFLLDERPPPSIALATPRGAARTPRQLAIRITGLAIHDTRSWFGSSDIRVDTLVVTRAAKHGAWPYRAETMQFKDIQDGALLPLHNALIYHGDVRDFVDLRIWVSRDLDKTKTLTELLAEQATSAEFRAAPGGARTKRKLWALLVGISPTPSTRGEASR